jgi:hypothetical protein
VSEFQTPSATAFEACSGIIAGAVYLIVGVAALARAPRDIRARLFFATALSSAVPYSLPFLIWSRGSAAAFTTPMMTAVALSLMAGSLTLFHFTQVFPWRRPWLRAHWRWLYAGYATIPVPLAVLVVLSTTLSGGLAAIGPGGMGAVSPGIAEGLALLVLVIVVPAILMFGLVVPCAAIYSLYKTWIKARTSGEEAARVTTCWILASQMAGGVLAVLIVPLLRLVAPAGPWVTIAAVLLLAFSLLMPLAFAAGVWRYGVLDLDPDGGPTGL